jgi:hypothetical protein
MPHRNEIRLIMAITRNRTKRAVRKDMIIFGKRVSLWQRSMVNFEYFSGFVFTF